jgi:hypothetical protein
MDQAVARARGEEQALATTDAPTSLGALGNEGIASLVRRADGASLAARLLAGEIEAAPQLLTLEEGAEIVCYVAGEGQVEIEDINTKAPKMVANWQLMLLNPDDLATGPRVSILGSAQLDRQLRTLVGKIAVIARGGEVKTGKGRRMTEYFVGELKTREAKQTAEAIRNG